MPASKHQLAASAYHLKPSDVRKLLLAATNFRDRCLIKTLWWLGVHPWGGVRGEPATPWPARLC